MLGDRSNKGRLVKGRLHSGVDKETPALVKRFVSPSTFFGDLDAEAAAALIAAAADVTLVLDPAGIVRDFAVRSDELASELGDPATWVGRGFAETVAGDSRAKIDALLRDAASTDDTRWRHINHLRADGRSVPVLYCCVQLGEQGRLVAFGRDLRDLSALQQRLIAAQQNMERDYSRLREVETRYRLLFQLSSEAVLILDATRLRVLEANPAARTIFGVEVGDLTGLSLLQMFSADTVAAIEAHLNAVRAGIRADDVRARVEQRGAAGPTEVTVKASFFRQEGGALFLVRIGPIQSVGVGTPMPDAKAKLLSAVEGAPDGFVVTDGEGQVITGNAAFLEMAGIAHEESARGRSLDNWVGASGVDIAVLMASLRQRGSVRFFSSTLRGEEGATTQVEISAVAIRNGGNPSFGFAIRNVGPRISVEPAAPQRALSRSVEQLTELIGQVPLKDLVREATEVIEKLCIEAALELTGNNRASAAEMLGLSRQSLYVKLRRYGFGDVAAEEAE